MTLKPFVAAAALAAIAPAHAALVNNASSFAAATVANFDVFDALLSTGPVAVAPGVTFTGTQTTLGASAASLGSNGSWSAIAGDRFASSGGPEAGFGLLHFTFDNAAASAAGAFLNSYNGGPILMAAYNAAGQMVEAHFVSVVTGQSGVNAGSFFGIARASADIRSIAFGGVGLVIDDLRFTAPVPEPEAWAMLLAGLGLIGSLARRRSR